MIKDIKPTILALTPSQPIQWQDSNPASNPAEKQASCATGLK